MRSYLKLTCEIPNIYIYIYMYIYINKKSQYVLVQVHMFINVCMLWSSTWRIAKIAGGKQVITHLLSAMWLYLINRSDVITCVVYGDEHDSGLLSFRDFERDAEGSPSSPLNKNRDRHQSRGPWTPNGLIDPSVKRGTGFQNLHLRPYNSSHAVRAIDLRPIFKCTMFGQFIFKGNGSVARIFI